jgi:diaminopimelate epimerase
MKIPFTKAHGAKNDFLLTPAEAAPATGLAQVARAICDRHTGIGADGWYLIERVPGAGHHARARLLNSDGSPAEVSGNGTRCAAAWLIEAGVESNEIRILTGAGLKRLKLMERDGPRFLFEMCMGRAGWRPEDLRARIELRGGACEATILDVGNPQCAVFVENFDFDWRAMGAELERHPRFPNRTNVSFVRPVDRHTIEVRIWERGAGETMSSGTGSTGAAAASILRGVAESPVRVVTPAGPLDIQGGEEYSMVGPAEIIARGEYQYVE